MKMVKIEENTKFPIGHKHCNPEISDRVFGFMQQNWLRWEYLRTMFLMMIFWQVKKEERQ